MFDKIKNENRALTNVLNETNDKMNDIKQAFRQLNEQETSLIQKRNEIVEERDMLKKKLKKARTVNEYLIARDNVNTSTLASESEPRQSSIEPQEFTYSMTSPPAAIIKSVKILDSLVYENNKNNDFDA
jgi:predicted nuclease with TOPRIM domain